MAEVHTTLRVPDVVFHNPAQHPLPVGAGVAVISVARSVNREISGGSAIGTTNGVVFVNPA